MFEVFKRLFRGEEDISPIEYGIGVTFLWAVVLWGAQLIGL